MDQYRVPFIQKFASLALNPFGGAICLAALLGASVLYFGGWPTTANVASAVLAFFDVVAMFTVIMVITEDEDWKLDVRNGLRPFERGRLVGLIFYHSLFSLATTIIGVAALHHTEHVGLVLACATFVASVTALTIMLLGRK